MRRFDISTKVEINPIDWGLDFNNLTKFDFRSDMEDDKFPIQTIDPAVFKMRNRNRKSADKSKSEKY